MVSSAWTSASRRSPISLPRLQDARTIIWNGPMGVFEEPPFDQGTIGVAKAVAEAAERGATVIVGGGDSVSAVTRAGVADRITHISTGGGATLEFLALAMRIDRASAAR